MSTQTSTFVKKLASNERLTREAAFESLQKYLRSKSSSNLSLLDMEKLWKGLYFAMWFSDKPKPQENLAESLAKLFSEVIPIDKVSTFHEAFWVIIIKEWPSIDQWRIDKYYMLIRRVLRHNFIRLRNDDWKEDQLDSFLEILTKLPLSGDKSISVALPYHLCDIYIEELETVLFEDLDQEELEDEDDDTKKLELYKENFRKKLEIVQQTPVVSLILPFEKLNKNALLKTLREKAKEEVLDDQRLKDWGVIDNESDNDDDDDENNDDNDDDDDDKEDEWTGF